MSYMTISSQEKHNFSLCSYFHAHPTTLLKILGGQSMGGPPTLNFGGPSPQSPLGLRPCAGLLIAVACYRYCSGATFTVAVAPLLLAESSGDSSAATLLAAI